VAVASAGPYASLYLDPDRQPRQHPTTQFLQAGCPSCRPTNSVKALKEFRIKRIKDKSLRIKRRKIFMFKMPFGRAATQSGHFRRPDVR